MTRQIRHLGLQRVKGRGLRACETGFFSRKKCFGSGGPWVSLMVHWSAPNVSNSIFVLGNAPRSVRIDAVVVSGGLIEGNFAQLEHHFRKSLVFPCVDTTLMTTYQTSPFKGGLPILDYIRIPKGGTWESGRKFVGNHFRESFAPLNRRGIIWGTHFWHIF